jgi:uncharacterized protein
MNAKEQIGEVMREFYEEGVPADVRPRIIDYHEKLRNATVIMGMRRTGKTYVTYQRMRELLAAGIPIERIVHLNFDDDRLKSLRLEDLHLVGEIHAEMFPDAAKQRCWYFLDELQDIEGWELYARRLLDSRLVQLCLTGSSSSLLSAEIATQMRGRAVEEEVFPLSFAEFLTFNDLVKEVKPPYSSRMIGTLRNAMTRYFEEGGFPDVQGESLRVRNGMLQGYVDSVIYRDVIERHAIPSAQALRHTLDHVVHNFARKFSTRTISGVLKGLGVSNNREYIADYLSYLEDAYLVYRVSIRTDSLSVRRANPDKFYVIDTGIIRALTPKSAGERGWLLENLVFMQLRRGFNKIEYYVTKGGDEVDFIVEDRATHARRLVQVAWEIDASATAERELRALRDARQESGIDDCVIVTWDTDRTTDDGIRIVPVWKWLIDEVAESTGSPRAARR